MVKRENLLVIAGLFWIFAGVNVAGIGVLSFFSVDAGAWPWMLAVMAVVFIGSFYPGLGAALALTGATLIAARWGRWPALR